MFTNLTTVTLIGIYSCPPKTPTGFDPSYFLQPTPGMFNFLEDEDSLYYRLRNEEPINYRIDFPTAGVVPKLTKVSVNGEIVCQSRDCK